MTLTKNDLEKISHHIEYEISNFCTLYKHIPYNKLFNYGSQIIPQLMITSLSNTYLLHMRCLYNFFYGYVPIEERQNDDVFAKDYFDNVDDFNPEIFIPKDKEFNKYLPYLNKSLAHLSKGRIKIIQGDRRQKAFICLSNQVKKAIIEFIKLKPKYLIFKNKTNIYLNNLDDRNIPNYSIIETIIINNVKNFIDQEKSNERSQLQIDIPISPSVLWNVKDSEICHNDLACSLVTTY